MRQLSVYHTKRPIWRLLVSCLITIDIVCPSACLHHHPHHHWHCSWTDANRCNEHISFYSQHFHVTSLKSQASAIVMKLVILWWPTVHQTLHFRHPTSRGTSTISRYVQVINWLLSHHHFLVLFLSASAGIFPLSRLFFFLLHLTVVNEEIFQFVHRFGALCRLPIVI